jgi:transposase
MAGRSRYEIRLSDEERVELEHRAASYSRPFREVQRARLVLYAADGQSNVRIGERLDMDAVAVARWRRRFYEERLEGLSDRKRAGRPRRFPPEQVALVKAIACELPQTHDLALSRFSRSEIHRLIIERGVRRVPVNDRALAGRGRDQAIAHQVVDLSPRPRLP